MDFNDTPQEAAYRAETRAWLQANTPKGRIRDDEDPAGLKEAKAWQAKKAAAGYSCIAWPKITDCQDAPPPPPQALGQVMQA